EGVGPDPGEQLEVMGHEGVVVALADHGQVFVLAEAGEVERLAVDQEPGAVNGHGPHADTLVVAVQELAALAGQLHLQVVQVAVARGPRVDILDREGAAGAAAGGDLSPVGVAEDEPDLGPVGPPRPGGSGWAPGGCRPQPRGRCGGRPCPRPRRRPGPRSGTRSSRWRRPG